MKKLTTLLVAMLFTAGMAFAQTDPDEEVTSDDIYDGASITQIGDFNDATINQVGKHSGEIYQDGGTNSENGNYANLDQQGNDHSGFISQVGENNIANIDAEGVGHLSVIVQDGNGHNVQFSIEGISNTVDIRQFGNSEHLVGNENSPISSISQNGDYNEFYSVQLGMGNGHTIYSLTGDNTIQNGNSNLIDVWQFGSGHTAGLRQLGDYNTAIITQFDANNTATVHQMGNDNEATIYQSGGLELIIPGDGLPLDGIPQ